MTQHTYTVEVYDYTHSWSPSAVLHHVNAAAAATAIKTLDERDETRVVVTKEDP